MTASVAPTVAIIVSTYNRARLLPRLVAAFEAQRDAPPFEVVIVDNASTDETAEVLERLAAATDLAISVPRMSSNNGPAPARDAGWRTTAAPYVVFTDDDCVPHPSWLAEMCRALDDADVVQGRTAPNPEQLEDLGPFSRTLEVPDMDGYFQTCNVAFRREWLERVDGFDLRFSRSCEDSDLAWRMIEQGASAAFASEALVHHDVSSSDPWRLIRATPRWGDVPLMVRVHPQVRDTLVRRMFWKPSHPYAIAAAAGLLLASLPGSAVRRAVGAALVLPYVNFRVNVQPLPHTGRRLRRLRLLPAALAVDLAEVGVLAAGSVRDRSLVL